MHILVGALAGGGATILMVVLFYGVAFLVGGFGCCNCAVFLVPVLGGAVGAVTGARLAPKANRILTGAAVGPLSGLVAASALVALVGLLLARAWLMLPSCWESVRVELTDQNLANLTREIQDPAFRTDLVELLQKLRTRPTIDEAYGDLNDFLTPERIDLIAERCSPSPQEQEKLKASLRDLRSVSYQAAAEKVVPFMDLLKTKLMGAALVSMILTGLGFGLCGLVGGIAGVLVFCSVASVAGSAGAQSGKTGASAAEAPPTDATP